jgi:O-antigen/teichoic acid export membrane protein
MLRRQRAKFRAGGPAQPSVTEKARRKPADSGLFQAGAEFIGAAGITLGGAVFGAMLMMGSEVLAARFLGVAGYGLYALAIMFARISAVLLVFGVPISILHYLPIQLSRSEPQRALGTILGSLPLPLANGLTLALVLAFCGDWVAARFLHQPQAAHFLSVLGFAIPLVVLVDLLASIARGFGRALSAVLMQNIAPQLCAICVLLLLLLFHGPKIGVAYGQVAGLTAGVAVGIGFVVRLVRQQIGRVRPVLALGSLYGYAIPIALNVAATLVIGFTDIYLLAVLRDAGTVGVYRACMQVVLAFGLPMSAIRAAIAPVYTVLIAESRYKLLQDVYSAAVRLATFATLPLLLVIIVNGGDLLRIMGPAFAIGTTALQVLACGQCCEAAFTPAHVVLIIGGRQRLEAGNMALAAGLNLVLNLTLIPAYGLLGAALSTATSLIGLAALRTLQLRRVLGLHTVDRTLLRVGLVVVPPTALVWGISDALGLGPGSGFVALAIRLVVMTVLIVGGLWHFCLEAQDRAMVLRLVPWRGVAERQPNSVVRGPL